MLLHCLLTCVVSDDKSAIILIFVPLQNVSVLAVFRFLLYWFWAIFIIKMLWFRLIHSWFCYLEFMELFGLWVYIFHQIFKSFHYYLLKYFYVQFSSLGIPVTCVLCFLKLYPSSLILLSISYLPFSVFHFGWFLILCLQVH